MNARRQRRFLLVTLLVSLVAASIGLVLYALKQNINLFYTPSEIIASSHADSSSVLKIGQRLRVGGLVVAGSVNRDPNSLKVHFDLTDTSGQIITVIFEGILPDLFREGQGIIAQGKLIAMDRVAAYEVLAKHDENYMPPELAKALNSAHPPKTEGI